MLQVFFREEISRKEGNGFPSKWLALSLPGKFRAKASDYGDFVWPAEGIIRVSQLELHGK